MRSINRLTLLFLLLLALTIVHAVATLSGQERRPADASQRKRPSRDRDGPDFESQFPVVDYNAPELAEEAPQRRRKEKNKRYDDMGMVSREPSEDVEETVRDNRWQERVAALPIDQSAAVVVGRVQGAEAYLSNSKSGVYTEFSIHVEEVLKSARANNLMKGSVIDADRPGGFVRYDNGDKELYRVFGMNMPRVGHRYVLFLGNPDAGPNYNIITGYELSSDGVSPLDVARHFDTYKGMDKKSFLLMIRAATEPPTPAEP